ncbi:hypothetical protein IQ250_04380 [Pseudanabaenaceae cyanobacterium LEGE 13415]|nr:hypothetical protein [Pseudanabaenaceae cyanobacterium LEGE 13415]
MVSSVPQPQNLTLHLVIEKTEQGRARARVLELPNCIVEAPTDEQAIEQLQAIVAGQFADVKVMPIEVTVSPKTERDNPWTEFIGMYEGDAEFAAIARALQLERGFDELGLIE